MSENDLPDEVQHGDGPPDAAPDASPEPPSEAARPPRADDTSLLRVALVIVGVAVLAAFAWTWSPGDDGETPPGTAQIGGPAAPPVEAEQPPIVVTVFAALDDRFVSEPCNRIPGGGLFSVRAFKDVVDRFLPSNLAVFMGDLSLAPGRVGAVGAEFHYGEIIPGTGIDIVAAGEGELGYGVNFAREVLARPTGYTVLCANAQDGQGFPILRGWSLNSVGGRNVLTVAVAGESVGYELIRRGSDVSIGSPVEAARKALEAGVARAIDVESPAHTKMLLVHGTVEEAERVLREVPGFDVAAAADGPILPELEPREVDGVRIHYGGRGLRFAWRVVIGDQSPEPHSSLARIGGGLMSRGSAYATQLAAIRSTLRRHIYEGIADEDLRDPDPRGAYVGNEACAGCHAEEAEAHARGPHASAPTGFLDSDYAGSSGCLPCHVTAPFHRGGWVPRNGVPGMDAIACEACHGPGEDHAVAPQAGYGTVSYSACTECHLPDRTPMLDAEASWALSGHGPLPPPPPPPVEPGDDDAE